MPKHPTDHSPSKYAKSCVSQVNPASSSRVLDLACGFGRHAIWRAKAGDRVVAIDVDAERIEYARRLARSIKRPIKWIVADIENPLPVQPRSFDLVFLVHYYSNTVIAKVRRALSPGGYFVLETFGAQGQNWQGLPLAGGARELLRNGFNIIDYSERPAGPSSKHAVVRALAQRRSS